eukprot:TRINITY_DN14750_c0_g1_i1.p1 TRINITY_DN14750_c0_g1~~TRINITY_DN14750_c0_g1_i1.p1  ORF type:complete len:223 (+),score=70.75 TRINITY_DN14750_c0_g1_i1:72-671(+)
MAARERSRSAERARAQRLADIERMAKEEQEAEERIAAGRQAKEDRKKVQSDREEQKRQDAISQKEAAKQSLEALDRFSPLLQQEVELAKLKKKASKASTARVGAQESANGLQVPETAARLLSGVRGGSSEAADDGVVMRHGVAVRTKKLSPQEEAIERAAKEKRHAQELKKAADARAKMLNTDGQKRATLSFSMKKSAI